MPVEARLEFGGQIIQKKSANPGSKIVPSFFNPLSMEIIIPSCELHDECGYVLVANAGIEPVFIDGEMKGQLLVDGVKERLSLSAGKKFVDFIDVSNYLDPLYDLGSLTIGQLVIEHLPAESAPQ